MAKKIPFKDAPIEILLEMARMTSESGDLFAAFQFYLAAAEAGNVEAMTAVGNMYLDGHGVEENPSLALELLQKAAALDNSVALRQLADRYASGKGVEKDFDKAVGLYTRAINQGDVEAMNELGNVDAMANLGLILTSAEGRMLDAYNWLKKSLAGKNRNALKLLGEFFEEHGNYRKALRWYKRAVDSGVAGAVGNLRKAKAHIDSSSYKISLRPPGSVKRNRS